jgi:hypothetical protein
MQWNIDRKRVVACFSRVKKFVLSSRTNLLTGKENCPVQVKKIDLITNFLGGEKNE